MTEKIVVRNVSKVFGENVEDALAGIEDGLDKDEIFDRTGAVVEAWVVVTGWRPHRMFQRWKLGFLDDPKGVVRGLERVHALARRGRYRDDPEVFEFLSRMQIPLDELEQVMSDANATSYEAAAKRHVEKHPVRVGYWATGSMGGNRPPTQ